jgi:hypothetical protein
MPNKITNKQRQQQKQIINRRKKQKQIHQKRIQQRKKKQKQIQQKRIQQRQQQIQHHKKRQQQLQKQRKIYQQRRQKKLKQLRQHQKKQRQLRLNRGCYRECQCNFHREDDYEYYGNCNYNHHNNNHHNNNQCSCSDCGINLPPSEVCVPSRNYQFFQLPNAPIYDIPDFGYGGGFGSGLGHDMRMPYISPHAGMDMFTGTLDAPIAPNPMYLSYPLF